MSAQDVALLLVALVGGYLIGSINPAMLIARSRGIDLQGSGSGNPGATNAGRVMGRKTGALVLLLDVLKGVVAVVLFGRLIGLDASAVAGFAAILGHMTSPWLHFRGGKGVATTLGVILAGQPLWLVPILLAFAIVFLITRRTGIGSVFGGLALIVTAALDRVSPALSLMGVVIGVLVVVRHHENIRIAFAERFSRHPHKAPS